MTSSPSKPSKLLFLAIDGCRVDTLTPTATPHILSTFDAYSRTCCVNDICWSGPGWSSCFTGVWRYKHNVHGNEFDQAKFTRFPSVVQRLKQYRPTLFSASIVNWAPINDFILNDTTINESYPDNDEQITNRSVELLQTESSLDALFVHLDDIDHAGHDHDYGPNVNKYMEAVKNTDARVGRILSALSARPTYIDESWLIVCTTDHGGSDKTHELGTPVNRTTFVGLKGDRVVPGEIVPHPLITDITPSILYHFGIAFNPMWQLDGRPIALSGGEWFDVNVVLEEKKKHQAEAKQIEVAPVEVEVQLLQKQTAQIELN